MVNVIHNGVLICECEIEDLEQLVLIDCAVTGKEKRQYWKQISRFFSDPLIHCFVARVDGKTVGYIIGEIRAWEFGQDICGWVFSLAVLEEYSRQGFGALLLQELQQWFKTQGVNKMRTMVSLEQKVMHRFFRNAGFVSGPYMQLEAEVD